jgi:hypothetical protein
VLKLRGDTRTSAQDPSDLLRSNLNMVLGMKPVSQGGNCRVEPPGQFGWRDFERAEPKVRQTRAFGPCNIAEDVTCGRE